MLSYIVSFVASFIAQRPWINTQIVPFDEQRVVKLGDIGQLFQPYGSLDKEFISDLQQHGIYVSGDKEVELVISGGAIKFFYSMGMAVVLLRLHYAGLITITKVKGVSAGAWLAAFLVQCLHSDLNCLDYFDIKYAKLKQHRVLKEWLIDFAEDVVRATLDPECIPLANRMLEIYAVQVTLTGFSLTKFDAFHDVQGIMDACRASSTSPFVTFATPFVKDDGYYVDGAILTNIPPFSKNQASYFLDTLGANYSPFLITNTFENSFEPMVMQGMLDTLYYLSSKKVRATTKNVFLVKPSNVYIARQNILQRIVFPFVLYPFNIVIYTMGVYRTIRTKLFDS
jgi:hypothetical protein